MVAAAIISWSNAYIFSVAEPDFAASLDVLARHGVGLRSGTINDMWLDICWGEALLGLGRPGAVEHIVRAARSADRLNVPVTLDRALRIVAIAAAEAGLIPQAATLAGYTEAALRPYQADQPGQAWIQARLEQALAGVPIEPSPPARHRREIINLVDDLETVLTQAAPGAPF